MAVTDHSASAVAAAYFDAVGRRDPDAMGELWAPDGRERIHGLVELTGGAQVRSYFAGLFAAFPDMAIRVTDLVAQDDRVAVHWRGEGTFSGEPFDGMTATGARVTLQGVDLLRIDAGRIAANDAYLDGLGFVRQLGLLPAAGSPAQARLTRAFNARTRAAARLAAAPAEPVAEGVRLLRGGLPGRTMNVFFIEDEDGGVTVFDAGIHAMTRAVARFGASRGGINRVVLGHAHVDHRGAAPGLGAPVLCHPLDRADAEGDGGLGYFDIGKLNPLGRVAYPRLLRRWDGGPVPISGTVEEGDEVSGFRVVHLPGHAPGMIALVRERDGLALTTDCFYTIDPQTGRHGPPRVPLAAFNLDTEQARASVRKLAGIPLRAAWPGHGRPLTGDVRAQLLRAADST